MVKKICNLACALLLFSAVAFAQNPQTPDVSATPGLTLGNAAWVNGIAPGYWPTAGAGLTLNISKGTSFCSSSIVTYAGGTLTLADNATNYVYLDTAASCAPSSSTSSFGTTAIPLAVVTTLSGAITDIVDDRTPFMQSPSAGSGITSLNGLSGPTQSFATGTAGTDFNISSTGSIHTFNLPDASATQRGALTSTDWSLFNGKVGIHGSITPGDCPDWYDSSNLEDSGAPCGGLGGGLFTSFQIGANTAITGSSKYFQLQVGIGSPLSLGLSGSGTSGSPYVATIDPPASTLSPEYYDSGSGTEASPWTNATDNAAGIQTAVNALESGRGGLVPLSPGRYDVSTPVTIATVEKTVVIRGAAASFSTGSGMTEPTTATKVHANSGATSVFTIGGGTLGNEPTGVQLENLYIWGLSPTPAGTLTNNVGIQTTTYVDQPQIKDVRITHAGVAFYSGFMDAGMVTNLTALGNGYGIYLTGKSWYATIKNSQIGDNGYDAVYAEASSDIDAVLLTGNHFVRNCSNASCSDNAQVYWDRGNSTISGNVFRDAGACQSYAITAGLCASSRTNVNEIDVEGDYNAVIANSFTETSAPSASCIIVGGSNNVISGNNFQNCGTDITIKSGATDNRIYQPGATISDSGTRTVINGVSTNAGDPSSAGDWNGVAKWAGLIIHDTSADVYWLYESPSTRVQLGGSSGVSSLNSLTGALSLTSTDSSVTITPSGSSINLAVAPGSSGAMVQLGQTVVATAQASISFSSITGSYTNLLLVVTGQNSSGSDQDVLIRFNGDSGTNYNWGYNNTIAVTGSGHTESATAAHCGDLLPSSGGSQASAQATWIFNYSGTNFYKMFKTDKVGYSSGMVGGETDGEWKSAAAITSITLTINGGSNFDVGTTATLYGMK